MVDQISAHRLRQHSPRPEVLMLIPEAMARRFSAIPLEAYDNTLRVAMANPADIFALETLATQSQMRIEPEMALAEEIQEAIDLNYKAYDEIEKQISNLSPAVTANDNQFEMDKAASTPLAQALTLIINEGVKARASDINIQPQEDRLRVRYRIDGALHDTLSLPLTTATPLVSRIKILANMNIADHHHPQDGQFSLKARGKQIDIRVGTMPTVCGEMVSLRLLDKSRVNLALSELGFLPESLAMYDKMLKVPHGIILVSGPTGAGKTTTLYASINSLDCIGRNIITVEDPVEYRFANINQIQVNNKSGVTFPNALRPILRLDPDVILVGEIRDAETASIATQAALTGHLVLSSIHANDAVGVILRLLSLGIEPFLVSSALIGVLAQRMVRRICPDCSRPAEVPFLEKLHYARECGEERDAFLCGTGCRSCGNTGYRGRTGIFEMLHMSDDLRAMVLKNATAAQLREQAVKEGMVSLMKDGMLKAKAGITTPAEVLRNTYAFE